MTTAQAKKYLGIPVETTTHDTDIAVYIPIVEATARAITGSLYLLQVNGTLTAGSKELVVSSVYSQTRILCGGSTSGSGEGYPYGDPGPKMKKLHEVLSAGMQITGDGIPAGTFIERVQTFNGNKTVYLSAEATASGDVEAYTDIPVMYLSAIAHGVWWMIGQQKTAMGDTSWTSRTVGPVSETRSEAEMKLDGQYGMPAWFVKTFPRVYR
jgi:hypothetical protein